MPMHASYESGKLLTKCRQLAADNSFDALLEAFSDIRDEAVVAPRTLLQYCDILMACGFLSEAERALFEYEEIARTGWRSALGLASIYSQRARHSRSLRAFGRVASMPESLVAQRGASWPWNIIPRPLSRSDSVPPELEHSHHRASRRSLRPPSANRKEVKSYESGMYCRYVSCPVGLFLRGVMRNHKRTQAFVYSSGAISDWVTNGARRHSEYRDVSTLSDVELAHQIRADAIDVLVDLSGHTGGSRLAAFAYRPAPVMVSWLGYCGTTGLDCMDGVVMDQWHVPAKLEAAFTESIIRLDHGRLCYQPVPFAPDVSAAPSIEKRFVTFGSFNNTAKLNFNVIALVEGFGECAK